MRSPVNPSAFGRIVAGTLVGAAPLAMPLAFRAGPCAVVSPAVVSVKDRSWGFAKGPQARDPDGHALELIER